MSSDDLHTFIFDGKPHLLSASTKMWLGSSRRFTDFADTYKDKIRKKIRAIQDRETLLDLRLELETAYLLLREQRFSLVYELGLSEKVRHPDFAVSFTTSLTFMVEVTRMRVEQKNGQSDPLKQTSASTPNTSDRLMDVIFSKAGQLLPKHSNILIVGIEHLSITQNDLNATMLRLQQRAERNESDFLKRYGFRDRAEFFQQYQRLSEILVRGSELPVGSQPISWINPQARYPLLTKVRTTLYRSHAV